MEETETPTLAKYELLIIILSDLGEEGTAKELDEIRKLISSNGGEIYHEDIWGNRELSYKIRKRDNGFYVVFNMNFPPDKFFEIQKALNIDQSVMRYLMISTPANYEIKTFEEYKAEEKAEEKEKKIEIKPKKRPEPKPEKVKKSEVKTQEAKDKVEPSMEPAVEPVKEVVKEVAVEPAKEPAKEPAVEPAKPEKPAGEKTLDELDEKLKSIINDPDITL